MINEDRIRVMTGLAIYEENQGKETISLGKYFRKDYMSAQMMKAFVFGTISYILLAVVIVYIQIALSFQGAEVSGLKSMVAGLLIFYVVYMIIYLVAAFRLADRRYRYAKESLKTYHAKLKQIQEFYDKEELFEVEELWEPFEKAAKLKQ